MAAVPEELVGSTPFSYLEGNKPEIIRVGKRCKIPGYNEAKVYAVTCILLSEDNKEISTSFMDLVGSIPYRSLFSS